MKIETLELQAGDLNALEAFYAGALGLPITRRGATSLGVSVGRSQLAFEAAPNSPRGVYHFAFNIPGSQLAEARAWLAPRANLIRSARDEEAFDFASWNASACYFYDPAGNIVELIARRDLGAEAQGAFSAASLLSISEVGLATESVPATVKLLQAELELPIFRGSSGDDFAALGNDEGLLIIVRVGRAWFPDTGRPAELLPLRVDLASGAGQFRVTGPPYAVQPAVRVSTQGEPGR